MPVEYGSTNPEKLENNEPQIEFVERDLSNLGPAELFENFVSLDIKNSDDERIGFIDIGFMPDTKTAMISTVEVKRLYRNQGYGRAVYKKAIQLAKDRGLVLRSSPSVTDDAVKMWQSLCQEGLAEQIEGVYYAK
jgi:ribosomal protein S18 acetylase RimI-like enzyme